MKFIILTQYYPPETGAPQNRLHSLSKYLVQHNHEVRVVTALPNYPKNKIYDGYRWRLAVKEEIDSVPIYRTWIFVSRSRSIMARLLNYFSFVSTSFFRLLTIRKADFLICESPPLFLGITAVIISQLKGMKLVFNVSDLWPESAEKLNLVSNKFILKISYSLESWIYKKSYLISGQTKGIVKNITNRFPDKKAIWFPNGVDLDFFEQQHGNFDWNKELGINTGEFTFLYAGIIGHAQGLEVIIKAAVRQKQARVKFLIVGDGPEKEMLVQMVKEAAIDNVIFLPNVEKSKIPSLIKFSGAYIVPLKKLDLFRGAIPSKLFEPLSLGKPILLGVEGEAKDLFIDEGRAGLFFEPENDEELADKISQLISDNALVNVLGKNGKEYVTKNFDRKNIHQKYISTLIENTND